ncbi:hypothetical protein ElyMa_003817300 [Elysia marginata]|uniref:Peptidase S1 domain-containing protein n=1 Tax=Elysia marginata TaxID=1093978 RepID=A0AAV4FFX6_9GAST|nr:hypothetical protein ElyMa_003817300 [Elysia marginata]
MLCATCDEDLAQRIESAGDYWLHHNSIKPQDLSGLCSLPSYDDGCVPAMIISHPHGRAKKISVGEVRHVDENSIYIKYNTPTCMGSSGAPVFVCLVDKEKPDYYAWLNIVHHGAEPKYQPSILKRLFNRLRGHKSTLEQINYGYDRIYIL